ncbi:MAG: LTA synthase family protein [Eubacterium sp.]|nr:LTA synthase family protein [Eubacterium sp.]
MKITTNKKSAFIGLVVTLALFVVIIVKRNVFLDTERLEDNAVLIYVLTFLAAVALGLAIAFRFEFQEKWKRLRNLLTLIWFFASPVIVIQIVETFSSKYIWDFSVKNFAANYICYLVFVMLVYAISHNIKYSIYIPAGIAYGLALANDIIQTFRGTPFVPADIISVKTGLNVVGNYDAFFDFAMILGSIMWAFLYFVTRKIPPVKMNMRCNVATRVAAAAYVAAMVLMFYQTDIVPDAGIKPDFWNQARGYKKSGTFLNFVLNTKYLFVGEPDGYNAEEVPKLVEKLASKSDYEPTVTEKSKLPNIIFIMNESFADLKVDGEFETNTGYLDFYESLTENTIKGNLSMPVNGAGTSNSEFEALTGLSLSFLPSGSNVYDSYLKNAVPSIVSTLGDLGYSRTAFHPYYGDGWSREEVYPLLEFEDFISIEDIIDQDIIDRYLDSDSNVALFERLLAQRYPGEDILLRRYVSDEYDYKLIQQMFENKDPGNPFFLFNVTMQNHGGYTIQYNNFDEQVQITSMSKIYRLANQYLSLIKVSDEALEKLIEYFSSVDEPTIICMFGDHQPYVETAFFEEIFGTSVDSLSMEQRQQRYITPFLIWANYDIEEKQIDRISSNYLSTLLLETAGLPMTEFNKYLQQLYKEIPVIDTVGYMDSEGNYYSYADDTEYTELLKDYEKIQYNALFDKDNKQNSVFRLPDQTHK